MAFGSWTIDGTPVLGASTFVGPVTVTSTTTPQAKFAYDGSNYLTVAVSSAGAVTYTATGTTTSQTFTNGTNAGMKIWASGGVQIGNVSQDPGLGKLVIIPGADGTALLIANHANSGNILTVDTTSAAALTMSKASDSTNGVSIAATATGGLINVRNTSGTAVLDLDGRAAGGKIATYLGLATGGVGVPFIPGTPDSRTGLTGADGAPITIYTAAAANQAYRVTADIFATAAVTGTASYNVVWTENSTTQTMSVTATAINVLGTASQLIRPDNGSTITAQLTGTFTGTFTVIAIVERLI